MAQETAGKESISFLSDLVKLPGILIREKTFELREEAKEKLTVFVSKLIVLFLLLGAAFFTIAFLSLALSN